MKYELRGREIFSEKGKLVATLDDDGNPVMAPGMAGPHTKGVQEFLNREKTISDSGIPESPAPIHEEEKEVLTEDRPPSALPEEGDGKTTLYVGSIPAEHTEEKERMSGAETREEWEISTIPEEQLPAFSKELGVNTPGFQEYALKHKLTGAQKAALVRRLAK